VHKIRERVMEPLSEEESYYAVLAVSPDATGEEIKRAYREKVRELHPDRRVCACNVERFKAVRRAYEVLGNPYERDRYDLLMGLGSYAGRPRLYRRSFERLFDCLFSGIQTAINNTAELTVRVEAARRKAG
jgi:curved DNA-binding protein CbpA